MNTYDLVRSLCDSHTLFSTNVDRFASFVFWLGKASHKIEAIRMVRAQLDLGLKESKDLCEAFWAECDFAHRAGEFGEAQLEPIFNKVFLAETLKRRDRQRELVRNRQAELLREGIEGAL